MKQQRAFPYILFACWLMVFVFGSSRLLAQNSATPKAKKPTIPEAFTLLRSPVDSLRFRGAMFLAERPNLSRDSVYYFYQLGDRIAQKKGDLRRQLQTNTSIGIHFAQGGELKLAEKHFKKTLFISKQIPQLDPKQMINSYNNLSIIYYHKGQYNTTLAYLDSCMQYESWMGLSDRGNIYTQMGAIYKETGDLKNALHQFKKSLAVYEQTKDKKLIGIALSNLGLINRRLDDYPKAIDYYQRALTNVEQAGELYFVSEFLTNLAALYIAQKKYQLAEPLERRAIAIRRQHQFQRGLAMSLSNYGLIVLHLRGPKESLAYLEEGLTLAKANKDINLMLTFYKHLSNSYDDLKEYEQAIVYFKRYTTLNDSLRLTQNHKASLELQHQFQEEHEQKQLEALARTKQRQRTLAYSLSVALALGGIFAFVFYKQSKLKRAHNSLLKQQQQELELSNHVLEDLLIQQALQKDAIQEQNEKILDSLDYAQRIQLATLPTTAEVEAIFPAYLIYYFPRDIVSGDFYWVHQHAQWQVLVVADCTGHGIPGAFMSVIGSQLLNDIIAEEHCFDPGEILNQLETRFHDRMHQSNHQDSYESIHLGICVIDSNSQTLHFSGAHHKLHHIRDEQLNILPGNRFEIGGRYMPNKHFESIQLDLQAGDRFYLFTDGLTDQFGGPRRRKFTYKRLHDFIIEQSKLPMEAQLTSFLMAYAEWQGTLVQLDDMLLIGFEWQPEKNIEKLAFAS
jgi:serine phosphatase RsbU (regulator of sigma subunit)